MSKYTKSEVMQKLRENGLRPVYNKKTKQLMYFIKPKSKIVGIKLLGYLDFLGKKAIQQ